MIGRSGSAHFGMMCMLLATACSRENEDSDDIPDLSLEGDVLDTTTPTSGIRLADIQGIERIVPWRPRGEWVRTSRATAW